MRILSMDTSTPLATIAVTCDDKVLAETLFNTDRTLSVRLIAETERLLANAGMGIGDVELFAASIGPGSFTGIRAGVATVQGFSLATGKPCIGFSTLSLLAMNFPMSPIPVCTLLDARKNEVYAALLDCSAPVPVKTIHDCVMTPQAFLEILCSTVSSPVIFAGDGAIRYREVISARMGELAIFPPFPQNICHAASAALLAMKQSEAGLSLSPEQLLPVYLRASEAEYAKLDRQKKNI